MPHFDRTGPHGEGSKTGKRKGRCSTGKDLSGMEGRLRQHNRGCKSKHSEQPDFSDFKPNDIVGVKRCRKRQHHSN